MTLHSLNTMRPGEPSISIHDKCDMLRDGALAKRTDEELLEIGDCELDGRGGEEPSAEAGQVH